jgi:hypothetical protein
LNVTPLLDLAFVLLIIFMITTPLMETASISSCPFQRGIGKSPSTPGAVQTVAIDREETRAIQWRRPSNAGGGGVDWADRIARGEIQEVAVVIRSAQGICRCRKSLN